MQKEKSNKINKHCLYVAYRKMVQMNLFTKQEQRYRGRQAVYGYQGSKRGMGWIGGLEMTYIHCYE